MSLSKEESYAMFDMACNAIVQSNVIMTQQPINNLMKLIAYNDAIRSCVWECYRGINYEQVLRRVLKKDEQGNYSLQLPTSRRAVVALVSRLLYEFFTGTQSMETLIKMIYPQEDIRGGFVHFCEDVMFPYKEAFREVFMANADDEDELDVEQPTMAVINSAVVAEVGAIAGDIRSELLGDNRISAQTREELVALVDGLCEVLESDLPALVRPMWLGIRYAFAACKKCPEALTRLQNTLAEYMLVDA